MSISMSKTITVISYWLSSLTSTWLTYWELTVSVEPFKLNLILVVKHWEWV